MCVCDNIIEHTCCYTKYTILHFFYSSKSQSWVEDTESKMPREELRKLYIFNVQ